MKGKGVKKTGKGGPLLLIPRGLTRVQPEGLLRNKSSQGGVVKAGKEVEQ